jgi:hypothetical protein
MTEAVTPPQPGTPEYEAAMIAKFDAHVAGQDPNNAAVPNADTKPAKPEGVPDKFWNAEKGTVDYSAWSKSTTEAERKLTELSTSQKQTAEAKAKADAEAKTRADTEKKTQLETALATVKGKADAKPEEIKAAQDALDAHLAATKAPEQKTPEQKPNVKQVVQELTTAFAKNGNKLTDDDYAKAEQAGFDRETVDAYIAGQQAVVEKRDSSILEGAKVTAEQFGAMAEWAKANLKAEEITAFNESLAKGSVQDATRSRSPTSRASSKQRSGKTRSCSAASRRPKSATVSSPWRSRRPRRRTSDTAKTKRTRATWSAASLHRQVTSGTLLPAKAVLPVHPLKNRAPIQHRKSHHDPLHRQAARANRSGCAPSPRKRDAR